MASVDFLELLNDLPDALAASVRSRELRNAQAHRLIAPPPPGTPLLVSLALAFEHTGIYLGDNRVAELNGDGCVKAVSLTRFINGTSDGVWSIRNGTRIFAACDARTRRPLAAVRTLKTARAAVEGAVSWNGYDFIKVNCHLFTAACVRGVLPGEKGGRRLLGGGIASVGRLEDLLAEVLNDGRGIAWCPVRRGKADFHYRLTMEKQVRLLYEGAVAGQGCGKLL